MMNNAYAQYKNQSLSTLTSGELLVKLFDEMIKQCRIAELSIDKNDMVSANASLQKAQTIVSTLAGSLDMRFPISSELRELYIFFAHQLLEANTKKDVKIIAGILPLLKDLRDSFSQADKISRMNTAGGKAV